MQPEIFFSRLENQAAVIRRMLQWMNADQACWKPSPESWSVLEVVNHLYDEEREDFRAHLEHVLFHAGEPWPSIDPQGWVTGRQYNQRDLQRSVNNFVYEREKSLLWLRSLGEPNWQSACQAPWGVLKAGDVLVSWAAHDLLHTRQLVELQWAYSQAHIEPFSTAYAGDW